MEYPAFFQTVTEHPGAYPYQTALSAGPWPTLLDIPTGLGKTAAIVVAWMWRRLHDEPDTGRRLIYCLPMRVLVDQVFGEAERWCQRASEAFSSRGKTAPTVHLLMGGNVDLSWDKRPESDVILVGTQDMLLSRALCRGYAMSRYRWPMHFALLNNDCMWVFDETQVMGVGVETSAQLDGLRRALGTHGPRHSLWMSATLGQAQLDTIDHARPKGGWPCHQLAAADHAQESVKRRTQAQKAIAKLPGASLSRDHKKTYDKDLAAQVVEAHQRRGGLTLVVLNRVDRAQALYHQLVRTGLSDDQVTLIHSRFRRSDRAHHEAALDRNRTDDRVVVATQVVEAGVDISARTLFSELCPWPALVQRIGRCNRYGEQEDAKVWWIDITSTGKDDFPLPYQAEELERARQLLGRLSERGGDAGPDALRAIDYQPPDIVRPVLRRYDLLDLFDTTPDLCGNDVDIGRYIRDDQDLDCRVFWRDLGGEKPRADLAPARPEELCAVSLRAIRDFVSKLASKRKAAAPTKSDALKPWVWDGLDGAWQPLDGHPHPGLVILLDPAAGGYDPALGWTGEVAPKQPLALAPPTSASDDDRSSESLSGDPDTATGVWVPLTEHLGHVEAEAGALSDDLALDTWREVAAVAGRWHDVGKAHDAFQSALLDPVKDNPQAQPTTDDLWAKSAHKKRPAKPQRPQFRHELASALAWLTWAEANATAAPQGDQSATDAADLPSSSVAADLPEPPLSAQHRVGLIAYLVAAHHGKVRLSLRPVPNELAPPGRLYARGVWHGDELPAVPMPDGTTLPVLQLDLSCLEAGPGSWLERTLALRDHPALGPFRLALLETIVRVADWRASSKEQSHGYDQDQEPTE